DQTALRVVVRRDEYHLAGNLAEVEAHEQISETVPLARREERDPWPLAEIVDVPSHVESLGDPCERGGEVAAGRVDVELDALQEEPGRGVGVLVGFDDVPAGAGHERTDRGDDAGLVRALEKEHRA